LAQKETNYARLKILLLPGECFKTAAKNVVRLTQNIAPFWRICWYL